MHQRFMAGEDVSYGDSELRRTGQSMARGGLLRAVEALAAGVENEEIVDAICCGDRTFEATEGRQYVEAVRGRRASMQKMNARLLRHLLGDHD